MVVKRFFISISVLFFYALLLQAKNEVIDHGQFLCSYYYCYSKDTIKNDEKGEDLLFLSIGKNVSKCYSYYTYQCDSLMASPNGDKLWDGLSKCSFGSILQSYQYFARLFPQAFYRNDEGRLAGIEQNDEESSGGSTRFPG